MLSGWIFIPICCLAGEKNLIVADKRKKVTNRRKEAKELTKLQQLEKENAQLKLEVDLLKKWQRFLAEERKKDINLSKD